MVKIVENAPQKQELNSRKTLGDSVFSFSLLDSAWPNYKNSPILIHGQNKKFKFVLQCYLLNTETQ